jgi:iron-sulfur cluster repair protein YtfE (RIC family)
MPPLIAHSLVPSVAVGRAADWSLAISEALTVGDLVRLAPSTLTVLADRGLEPVCGGARTLADLAGRHRVAIDELLEELRESAAVEDASRRDG